jgi:hypothetical protein
MAIVDEIMQRMERDHKNFNRGIITSLQYITSCEAFCREACLPLGQTPTAADYEIYKIVFRECIRRLGFLSDDGTSIKIPI